MLKFAYQGQPGPGGTKSIPHGPPGQDDKTSVSTHSHSGEDDSCCEVCHHRKRELSREKTRVNRARSRSRERIPRGYVSSSDTSTAFSEESRSRTDTSSEDASSLSCQNEERSRKTSRPDLTQCDAGGAKDSNKENERKSSNGKKGFILFKMFQKARMNEKKPSRQCPVCGNEEREGCCISNGSDLEQDWIGNGIRKQMPSGKISPKSDNDDYINAWRYNDGNLSSCETKSCYSSSKYFSCEESSPSYKSRNRYRNNESDSECMVRRRKMQRTKSGSELCHLERNNNCISPKGRPVSRSCEKLQSIPKILQEETKEDFGAQFVEVVLREDTTDKSQKRYRKKNRRSKSCEKLNITNSPQKQSYRNYDSDWEVRPTVQTTVASQTSNSKQRKALSCERLGGKSFETDDELRQREHKANRKNSEQKVVDNVASPSSPGEELTLVSRAPVRHAVKEATVRKTKTMRSRHSPPDGGAVSGKPKTLPRQRSCQSDTEGTRLKNTLPKQHSHEHNFNQNGCTVNDVTNRSRTLDHRLPKYSESPRSFDSDQSAQSFHAGTSGQGQNQFNSLPHNSTRCFQQSDDAIGYTSQLRQVSTAQREQLFSPSSYGQDDSQGSRAGEQQSYSRTRSKRATDPRLRENLVDYTLPEDASIGSGDYPSSNEDTHSLLETSIDSSSNVRLGKHTRYTSLTSLSTTVSTTSEDSMDSGNGSLSDRAVGNPPVAGNASRYSPIEAERQRKSASGTRPLRPPLVPQRSCQETSDYESETCSADLNSLQGRSGSPRLGQDSSRAGSPSAEVYRPPRIRYVHF